MQARFARHGGLALLVRALTEELPGPNPASASARLHCLRALLAAVAWPSLRPALSASGADAAAAAHTACPDAAAADAARGVLLALGQWQAVGAVDSLAVGGVPPRRRSVYLVYRTSEALSFARSGVSGFGGCPCCPAAAELEGKRLFSGPAHAQSLPGMGLSGSATA